MVSSESNIFCLLVLGCSCRITPAALMQEDYHFTHTGQQAECCIDGQTVKVEYTLIGVLDGHGGKKAAEFSSKQVRTDGMNH